MDSRVNHLVDSLLESYATKGGINNIDRSNLPSKRAISDICADLLQILFPGLHDQEAVHSSDLELVTRYRMNSIADRLKHEICKSLRTRNCEEIPDTAAQTIFCTFLKSLPRIRELLHTDVAAAYDGDPAADSFEEILLSYPFVEAVAIQRMAHVLYQQKLPLIPRMMTEWAHGRTGIDIHPGAQIGDHFFIDHGTGVVIGETCVIGNRVKLYHGVTLGAKSFQKDDQGRLLKSGKRHPNVEDGVVIYPNSTVLGGETVVGARSTIGGNVFLMQSVPPDSLVYYEETQLRILSKLERNSKVEETFEDFSI